MMIFVCNKPKLSASLTWSWQWFKILNNLFDGIFSFSNIAAHRGGSVHTKHNVNNKRTFNWMLAIKSVIIWMPRFFRTEFIFSMRWMIADKATKWCSLNMVAFYWLLPINWAPIWVAKPLIENFIFIRMIFQSWMSHIFINFGCTSFEAFTFF